MQDSNINTPNLVSVKERLLHLLKVKHMSQAEFARHLGVSPTYIGAMRKSVSNARLQDILQLFPDIDKNWLLYGEGEMYKSDNKSATLAKDYIVPLLPVDACAGSLQMWSDGVALKDCRKIVSPVPGADFAIHISGNSMEPVLPNGAILFIKRINSKAFIPWGNPMVIDTENGVLVKTLYPVDNTNTSKSADMYIEARSYNPDYPPIIIPAESIYGVYRILTSVLQYSTI